MKLNGLIFMMFSWGFIIGLAVFCFSKILRQGLDGKIMPKKAKK